MGGRIGCDVAIIGGGPAGSTAGSLLKKYMPELEVAIFERESFPRDHVGESQLPPISYVLDEMGCWDQVEAAGFPIKVGATYRWGSSPELWDFNFVPPKDFRDDPRPARFEGQRRLTAFQVERARYDQILLRHAESLGCTVREATKVAEVTREGDKVTGLTLDDGSQVEARFYLDGSGGTGFLRRAMGVGTNVPTRLKNVAFWDYWENAEWAVSIGTGGTRVLVLSIGTGWIWFIPLGPTRTSIGYVCPAEHAKTCGMSPAELYDWALAQEPLIQKLTANATRENEVQATRDWSFLADRMAGENWMLIGESAGFADPILAAGLTLTHAGAREAAYVVLSLLREEHDPDWLKTNYQETQATRIGQHIRFADFWYSANGQFTELQDYTQEIARDAGLELSAEEAFQWLGTGGFIHDISGQSGIGGFDLIALKGIADFFAEGETEWQLNAYNCFRLDLEGAEQSDLPLFQGGRIKRTACFRRDGRQLPVAGAFALTIELLRRTEDIVEIYKGAVAFAQKHKIAASPRLAAEKVLEALETMVADGWVAGRLDPDKPRLTLKTGKEGALIHGNHDLQPASAD